MKIFFYCLFVFDIVLGIALSVIFNLIIGIITACVLLFINIITFNVILKMEKKRKEVLNIK